MKLYTICFAALAGTYNICYSSVFSLQNIQDDKNVKRVDRPCKFKENWKRSIPNTCTGRAINKQCFMQQVWNIVQDTKLNQSERSTQLAKLIRNGLPVRKAGIHRVY